MNYDDIKDASASEFVKMEQGDNKVRIVTEFEQMWKHFDKAKKTSYVCFGKDGCSLCDNGQSASRRFMAWAIDRKDGQIKLLEVGKTVIDQIKLMRKNPQYAFDKFPPYDITINRVGSTMQDTVYTVMADRANSELNINEQDLVRAAKPILNLIAEMEKETREALGMNVLPVVESYVQDNDQKVPLDQVPF